MPGSVLMKIKAFHRHATAVFCLRPMHDGVPETAIHSGARDELDKDQSGMFGVGDIGRAGRGGASRHQQQKNQSGNTRPSRHLFF